MSGDFTTLLYQTEAAQARITLHRPDRRNALSGTMVDELIAAFARADADDGARVIVLTGSGDKAFCAGGDLGTMQGEGVLAAHFGRARFGELFTAMRRCGKPIVARVQGDALGGGFGLAMGCDLVVAADDARFGTPEIGLGLFPHVILVTLLRSVPRRLLQELVLTGRKLTAAEALSHGLINRAVPRAELDAATDALAAAVAAHSPAILRLGRHVLHTLDGMDFDQGLAFATSMLTMNTLAEDAAEGVLAFLEKRPPVWKGR